MESEGERGIGREGVTEGKVRDTGRKGGQDKKVEIPTPFVLFTVKGKMERN